MYMNRKGLVFGYKDTWSLDSTLAPIIHSALVKFQEVTSRPENKDCKGIPGKLISSLFTPEELIGGHINDEQMEIACREWERILELMIYAFDYKNEPDMKDYNFKFTPIEYEPTEKEGYKRISFGTSNEEEYNRYRLDERDHQAKVEEGHSLFGKYFQSLWW